jgi:hypothetical protein
MSAISRLAALGLVLGLTGHPLDGRETELVEEWLVCFDCGNQPDSVQAIAARKPEAAVDTLNRALVHGPPPLSMTGAADALGTAFTRDSAYRVRHQLPPRNRHQYVAANLDRYVNGYRARGATALGWIHTPRAVAALKHALILPLQPSVLAAVRYAIDSLPAP